MSGLDLAIHDATFAISPMTSSRLGATLVGGIAVLLWATLALFTTTAAEIPPFELVALTFAIAFLLLILV